MDYFVSTEDTAYQNWQIELLIESFRLHGLEDSLVIAVAENREPKAADFTFNIRRAKRIFRHENIGRKRGCLPLNRPYSLFNALEQGLVKQPLTLIDPDMVLVYPVPVPHEQVNFQLDFLFTSEFVENNHCEVRKHVATMLKLRNEKPMDLWIPLGGVRVFNNTPIEFFRRVVEWSEMLEFDRRRKLREAKMPQEPWWQSERTAWCMALLEYQGHLSCHSRQDLEMTLLDNNKIHHFIHYQHGLPPVFSKHMYTFEPPLALAMGSLFDTLLEHNPTSSTHYFQGVVRSYLSNIPRQQLSGPMTGLIPEVTVLK